VPELPEVEGYRRLALAALDRPINSVATPDAWYLKRGASPEALGAALAGGRFVAARRRGKLMLLDVAGPGGSGDQPDSVLGVHFGMSGRLVCDGAFSVDRLMYTTGSADMRYQRFGVGFADGGHLAVVDPRRLGGVELDPDENRLGPDALTSGRADLEKALGASEAPLKARLLDQARIAGVGNLIADEILWRAGLDPCRPAGSLSGAELRRLHRHLHAGLADLIARGGSHTGDLQPERHPGGICPKDGSPLKRATVGGRTTWWCPRHQR
jgi:formamidopyrimidine-DNA glycosylase